MVNYGKHDKIYLENFWKCMFIFSVSCAQLSKIKLFWWILELNVYFPTAFPFYPVLWSKEYTQKRLNFEPDSSKLKGPII